MCVDIYQFTHHCESVVRVAKNPWACYVYGENTYTKYGVCSESLHMIGRKGPHNDTHCFLKYYDPSFFGL